MTIRSFAHPTPSNSKSASCCSPESVVLEMDVPTLCELLRQLDQPDTAFHAVLLRQRITNGETVDQVLETFAQRQRNQQRVFRSKVA